MNCADLENHVPFTSPGLSWHLSVGPRASSNKAKYLGATYPSAVNGLPGTVVHWHQCATVLGCAIVEPLGSNFRSRETEHRTALLPVASVEVNPRQYASLLHLVALA